MKTSHRSYETAKSIARRSDLFGGPDEVQRTSTIIYRSGRSEGSVTLLSELERNQQLDSVALALLMVLCDLHRQGRSVAVTYHNYPREAIVTTGRELALAVFGRDGGNVYRRLGVVRPPKEGVSHPSGSIDALTRLQRIFVEAESTWLGADGKSHRVGESFHLIDFVKWHQVDDQWKIFVGLSPALMDELNRGSIAKIPQAIVQALPKQSAAGRVAAFMLSHQPIQGAHREIGAEALVPIIRPDAARLPDVNMSHYRAVVRGIIQTLNTIDDEHIWGYVLQGRGKPGKVTCDHKK